ncbi:MAG TPA: hypothetical protein VK766_03770 [Cytophagaceae bacterium]|jgi:hypothetical protein|nr:hypothetical protein [Cytophagaceae bacterium]
MKKILFIIGSPNQTSQMHKIASYLDQEYDCYYSQFYSDNPIIKLAVKTGILDHTIFAGHFKQKADQYLEKHGLKNDYAQTIYNNTYDMVILCSDLLVPTSVRNAKTIWVQEGMTDPLTKWAKIVKALKLPRYFSVGTALNGSSNLADIFCVASEGYKKYFAQLGTDPSKIIVTGMPNFDNVAADFNNNFPYKNFVLVATSDIRECFGKEDRPAFIREAVKIANGRQLIFKLHPNEITGRAIAEIKGNAPENTLIYTEGNINAMIANCEELITQYSTVVYIGLAQGKKVHSYFNIEELKEKIPVQNDGQSAANIAAIAKRYMEYKGDRKKFIKTLSLQKQEKVKQKTIFEKIYC